MILSSGLNQFPYCSGCIIKYTFDFPSVFWVRILRGRRSTLAFTEFSELEIQAYATCSSILLQSAVPCADVLYILCFFRFFPYSFFLFMFWRSGGGKG